jgi:nucleotide-binding universal stress UspA family protein
LCALREIAQFRKLLIGYDGSPGAELALRYSLPLAKQLGSEVHVLWVDESRGRLSGKDKESSEYEWAEEHFKSVLVPQIDESAGAAEISIKCAFKIGNAAQSIISEADRGRVRLVALGHRGSNGIWGRFLGGVADRVSNLAHCDVLIVKQKE